MNQKPVDEQKFISIFREKNLQGFYKFIEDYDKYMYPIMRGNGWTPVIFGERSVSFTFGEVTFSRRGYKKDGTWCYPVDEKLGLEKHQKCSRELLFHIAQLSTMLPYRKVVRMIEMSYGVYITHMTVSNAVRYAAGLFNERDEYRYYEEYGQLKKIKADVLYIEGDGVMLNSTSGDKKKTDLAHFIVHTGSKKVAKNRSELQNKRSIISNSHSAARDMLENLLDTHYDVTKDTVLITNSDMGKGYTPHFFINIAKFLGVKRHEHFWDLYHLNKKIQDLFRSFDRQIVDHLFKAIKLHKKKSVIAAFDTAEGLCETEELLDKILDLKKKVLRDFQYTKPAHLRGFTHQGIGVMETQHRKVTYRMKHQSMYWSTKGVEAMSRMIVLDYQKELRDLFFGDWREKYKRIKDLPAADEFLKEAEPEKYNTRLNKRILEKKLDKAIKKTL